MNWISRKWMLFFASRRNKGRLALTQRNRLHEIVGYAKKNSAYFNQLYNHIDLSSIDLLSLPPTTKPELMANFDDWVTDSRVTLESVQRFLGKTENTGQLFLDSYSVWFTSGTSGDPGIFLHDSRAQSVYNDLVLFRAYPQWLNLRQLIELFRRGFRYTLIIATGGPYAGVSSWEQVRQRLGRYAGVLSTLSIDHPIPELVRQLNEIQPIVLASYPSMLYLLAMEQMEGKLHISPEMLAFTGEWLDPEGRLTIEKAFAPARLVELYGASEFPYMATSCRYQWLHLNADWVILEPVDQNMRPVAPGEPSHTVLLTNLANRIQPILRYNLGDSVTLQSNRCQCGSRLPALRVEGRHDEILTFYGQDGRPVRLLPMALAEQVEITPGVRRYQIIQTGDNALQIRLEVVAGSDLHIVWSDVIKALDAHLCAQGLPGVKLSLEDQLPHPDPRSGKFRLVWSEVKDQTE